MKFLIFSFMLIFSNQLLAGNKTWGEDFSYESPVKLENAVKSLSKKPVIVSAKVGKVCQKKGCWMTLENQQKEIRVTFDDYSFFVPVSLIGKNVIVKGTISEYKMDVKEARHYAEDEGQKDVSHITKPVKEYRIVAKGVKLL